MVEWAPGFSPICITPQKDLPRLSTNVALNRAIALANVNQPHYTLQQVKDNISKQQEIGRTNTAHYNTWLLSNRIQHRKAVTAPRTINKAPTAPPPFSWAFFFTVEGARAYSGEFVVAQLRAERARLDTVSVACYKASKQVGHDPGNWHYECLLSRAGQYVLLYERTEMIEEFWANDRHHDGSPMDAVLTRLRRAGPDFQEYLALMDEIDWTATSLGPLSEWPQELATQFYLVMLNPTAEALTLGDDTIVIYNKDYADMIGDHHPSYFGRPITTWVEWEPYMPVMQRVMQEAANVGRAVIEEDHLMYLPRQGVLEEIFMRVTVVLLPPPLVGFLATCQNTTQEKVRDRRISSLKEFAECWKSTQDLDDLWNRITAQMTERPKQFCFNALYTATLSADAGNASDSSSTDAEDVVYNLLHGEDRQDLEPVRTVDLSARSPWTAAFRKAHQSRAPALVAREDIPQAWQDIARTSGGFNDTCQQAVVLPSQTNKLTKVQAFLVLGLSTRRSYDDAYKTFLLEVQRLFADAVTNCISTREAEKKKRDSAKRTRIEKELLQKELRLKREQAALASSKVDRFRAIAEGVEVGVFEQKISGEIVEANDAYYRISGFSRNPVDVRKDFEVSVYEEDIPAIELEWNALAQGESRSFEIRYRNGNYGLASCIPLKDIEGNVTAITGILTNITAMKRIDASEGRFKRFLTICPEGIIIGDTLGRLTFCNDHWFAMSGHPKTRLDDIDWLSVVHEDDQERCLEAWKEFATGKPIDIEIRVKRIHYNTAGEACGPATLHFKGLAEMNDTGGVEQMVALCSDVSHLKFAEQMQQVRLDQAVEAKRQQESFMDMVSHEIRNPLSAIVHCADSCSDSLWNMSKTISQWRDSQHMQSTNNEENFSRLVSAIESSLESVETISACSGHMRRIVDDVLSLSKLDSNLVQISPSVTNTTTLLKDIHKMFDVEAQRVGVRFEVQSDVSINDIGATWCSIDPGRVTQVIVNLVTNAIKFTKGEDREDKRVIVEMGASRSSPTNLPVDLSLAASIRDSVYDNYEAAEHDCYLWFVCRDNGCGMSTEEQTRIFGRFAQGNIKTYNTYGGSGLGLFISRSLVELQGGEIGVASKKHSGSTFAFYVKSHTADPPRNLSVSHDHLVPTETESGNLLENKRQHPIGVLIVEDNEINRRVLKQQLTKHGYNVNSACNGQEALDFIKTTQHWRSRRGSRIGSPSAQDASEKAYFDLILMDIEMPLMGGLECAKKIRELQKIGDIPTKVLPIIAVSANARVEQQSAALDAGMDDTISKPFRIPDLIPKVERLVAWARTKKQT